MSTTRETETKAASAPYLLLMSSEASFAPGLNSAAAGLDPASFRWIRPLALAAVAIVVTASFFTHPRPGLTGDHLAVAVALVVFAAGTVAVVRFPNAVAGFEAPILAAAVLAAAVLVG